MTTAQARKIVKTSRRLAPASRLIDINLQLTETDLSEIVDGAERIADETIRGPFSDGEDAPDICRELKTQTPSAWGAFARTLRKHLR